MDAGIANTDRIEEIRERCNSITPGPWGLWVRAMAKHYGDDYNPADIEFLSCARQDIPYLLSEIDRLTAELTQYRQMEQEGVSFRLPCKTGDTVYQIRSKKHAHGVGVSPRIVSCASVWTDGNYTLHHQGKTPCRKSELGKTWFLTERDARIALGESEQR